MSLNSKIDGYKVDDSEQEIVIGEALDARTLAIQEAAKEVAHYMGVPLADCHCAQAVLALLKKEKQNAT